MSQILEVASQAPETNMFLSGERDRDMTSPVWSLNSSDLMPASISHSMQDMSPELVMICRSEMKRQQER